MRSAENVNKTNKKAIEKQKNSVKNRLFLRIFACVMVFLTAVLIGLESATLISDAAWGAWSPDYEIVDLTGVLEKSQNELTEEDYALIYAQTGLTKVGADRLYDQGQTGKNRIKSIQSHYTQKIPIVRERFAPWTCWEKLTDKQRSPIGEVRAGDIIVTSATHVFGFRYGHAALVISDVGEIVEAYSPGENSRIGRIRDSFADYATFMILRPDPEKVSDETRKAVAKYARTELLDIPYTVFAGIFSKKAQEPLKGTQCAHIVWYAYNHFGIDLDSNGGCIVKPRDMANSEYMQVVQIYGFDPDILWT